MKVHWLALLLVIGAALTVPIVSAKIVEEKDGYVVTPGDNTLRLPEISRLSSASISQGQTQWYSTYAPRKTHQGDGKGKEGRGGEKARDHKDGKGILLTRLPIIPGRASGMKGELISLNHPAGLLCGYFH